MASVASQLIEEVTVLHVQRDSLENAREICADDTYFPNNLRNIGTATSLQRGQIGPDLATLQGSICTDIMTCTGGCGYSFLVLLMMGAVDTRNM